MPGRADKTPPTSPGPWRWKERGNDEPSLVDSVGNEVCEFGGGIGCDQFAGVPPNESNRALIASAPTLAAELNWAVEFIREHEWDGGEDGDYCIGECSGVDPKSYEVRRAREDAEIFHRKIHIIIGHEANCEVGAFLARHPPKDPTK